MQKKLQFGAFKIILTNFIAIFFFRTITVTQPLKIGNLSTNCGLPEPCSEEEFAVHLYTGKDHKDEPRLCVDGK